MLALPNNVRVFRNNVAMAWVGQRVAGPPGYVVLKDARPLHAGLCVGSSDLIGWKTVKVTPNMVSREIAVFTAIEVKTDRGTVKTDQANFISQVKKAGGCAGVARSASDAVKLINND